MKVYFEYDKEDYYGLVVVETKGTKNYGDLADKIYHEHLGDDCVSVLETRYDPIEVSKEYAFWKLAHCQDSEQLRVKELVEEFDELTNTCLVIDDSLI